MSKLIINGGKRLFGEVNIHGAKNSALPILAATVLCHGVNEIHNCPDLSDVTASIEILKHLGCKCSVKGDIVYIDTNKLKCNKIK